MGRRGHAKKELEPDKDRPRTTVNIGMAADVVETPKEVAAWRDMESLHGRVCRNSGRGLKEDPAQPWIRIPTERKVADSQSSELFHDEELCQCLRCLAFMGS